MTKPRAFLISLMISTLLVSVSHFSPPSQSGVLTALRLVVIVPGAIIASFIVPGGIKGNASTVETVAAIANLLFWTLSFFYAITVIHSTHKSSAVDNSHSAP
jgi:hypothetical protein